MIQKRIQPAAWFQERPTATLLNVYSKGFERAQLQKIAADDYIFTVDIKPEKGHSFVHLISLGAGEFYSANNNADYYNEKAREYTCPAGSVQLADGLYGYHNTFMKSGAVYRNHQNSKKGFKPEGEVVAETINPVMHRGELIIKVADDKWHDMLEKLAADDPIWFSIGCGVPYDLCTQCLNKASSRSSYCEHLRYNKLGLTKEGIQVCAINDRPHFHDISYLPAGNPADRIAFGLRKVAQENGAVLEEEDLSGIWIPLELMNKIASRKERDRAELLNKLAAIEKRISIEGMSPAEEDVAESSPSEDDSEDLVDTLKGIPLDKLFYGLNKKKMLLPPGVFISIVLNKPKSEIAGIDELPAAIKDIFGKLKEEGDFDELLHDGSYLPGMHHPGTETMDNIEDLAGRLSLDEEPVRHRIMLIAIRGGKTPKIKKEAGQRKTGAEAQYLAKEYAKYQLSFLAGTTSNELLQLVALNNQVGA